jgi:hypothetical protein
MYAVGGDACGHGNASGSAAFCTRVAFRFGCEGFWRLKRLKRWTDHGDMST